MDRPYRYHYRIWLRLPKDSMSEDDHHLYQADDSYVEMRSHYIHIDIHQPESITSFVNTFDQKLLHNISYEPSGNPIPNRIRINCICRIRSFVKSMIMNKPFIFNKFKDKIETEHNTKFIIALIFGASRSISVRGFSSLDDYNPRNNMVPASDEAIDGLQSVSVNAEDGENCAICYEVLKDASATFLEDVKCMPCKHLFHEDCIVPWLEQSHFCPLCRFSMPIAD